MKSKRKEKLPKSARTRLNELIPKKDTRGGRIPDAPHPDGGPSYSPSISARYKKSATA